MENRELFIFPTRNKQPLTPQGFKNARPASQWTGRESDQWGLPCGPKNGVFVVDVDNSIDVGETLTGVQYHEHNRTDWGQAQIVPTPSGGYHVIYKYTESLAEFRNSVRIETGTDFRTDGGYIILYADLQPECIGEMPSALIERFKRAAENSKKRLRDTDETGAVEGGRNAWLTRQAGKMQHLNVLTLAALSEINERQCVPPVDESEVKTIFDSVSRYAPEPDTEGPDEAHAQDLVDDMLAYLSNPNAIKGESTGIPQLDDLLGGGYRFGELTVTLAEAKSGKNTFWHYQMVDMLDRGIGMGYASRELDPATEVMPNLVTLAAGKNVYKNPMEAAAIKERIGKWRLIFSEGIGQYNDVSELFIWLEAKIAEGIKYFWIDHLHFCLPDSEDYKAVSNFIRRLRTVARGNMVHISLIIQPKGGTTQHTREGKLIDNDLDIGMLRGGASLGQGLDNLITMMRVRDDEGEKTDVSKISLKTTRNKLAKLGSFHVSYDRDKMTFSSSAKPSGPKVELEGNKFSRAAERAKKHRSPKDVPAFDLANNGYNIRKTL